MFGGSTTFGDGVPDESTVVAFLNELDSGNTFLNFSAQSYDSIREIDKLLYLLRKGYRPKSLVFIDGLNDISTFAQSPYEIYDSPRTVGFTTYRGQVPLVFGYPTTRNMWLALAYSLPVTHLLHRFQDASSCDAREFVRKNVLSNTLDWNELMYFYKNWARCAKGRVGELSEEIVDYYKSTIDFVDRLGSAFGFSSHFVYQPIGLLETKNPFLKPGFYESDEYEVYRAVNHKIRQAIRERRLPMQDCSRSIADSDVSNAYVDATHYSPQGNRVLAECILTGLPR